MKRFDPVVTCSPSVVGERLATKHLELLKQDILRYNRHKKFNALYDVVIRTIEDIKK